jgi:catechol 2,3-dioxygenase-like lactoylglutathione lyase family enzyme
MNLEHVGLNHPAPVAAAAWYQQNLDMKIARKSGPPSHGHFLADARVQMMVEYYHNAAAPFTDFKSLHPLSFHLAFQVDDVSRVRARLLQAGATDEGEPSGNDRGDQFAMLRDPWGLPVQLVKRHQPMVQ